MSQLPLLSWIQRQVHRMTGGGLKPRQIVSVDG